MAGSHFHSAIDKWYTHTGAELYFGDFNGDGRTDLMCKDKKSVLIDYADKNGHFSQKDAWQIASKWCTHAGAQIYPGDFNGDGRTDLICKDSTGVWISYADKVGHVGLNSSWEGGIDAWYDDGKFHLAKWRLEDGRALDVKYRAYTQTISDDIEYVIQDPNLLRVPFEAASNTLNVLSYNVKFLSGVIGTYEGAPHQKRRARAIAFEISGYDVIVFQEAFDNSARSVLISELKPEFPFHTEVVNKSSVVEDGGVIIVNRWPINLKDSKNYVFKNKAGLIDGNASKGVAYAKINKKGRNYHIFGTHLQAGHNEIKKKQVIEIRQFIDSLKMNTSEPVIIAGDFNINRRDPTLYLFNYLLDTLDVMPLPQHGGLAFSVDKTINKIADDDPSLIDHILFSKNHARPISSYYSVLLAPSQQPWEHPIKEGTIGVFAGDDPIWELSDHFPVHGHFVFK